jgi:hypothetical protein
MSQRALVVGEALIHTDGWGGRPISADRLEVIGDTAARAAAVTVSRRGADLPNISDLWAGRTSV